MAATDARPLPLKNTAFRAYYPILDNDGDVIASPTGLDSEVSIDGAAFADCTNEWTVIGSSGVGYIDLTAGEMNGDCIVLQTKTSSTDGKTSILVFYPQESGDIKVDVQSYGGTAGTFSGGRPEVNTSHWGGTAAGSATVNANVTQISGDSTAADNLESYTDGTTPMPVNATQLSGDATAADNAEAFFDGTGYAGTNNVIPLVTTTTTATNVTTVNGLAAGVITAASIAADAITDAKVAADVTIASVTGAVGSVTGNVGGNVAGSVGSVTAMVSANVTQISGDSVAADSLEAILDGSGGTLTANLDGDVTGSVQGSVASVSGAVTVGSINTGVITAASIADGAIDAATFASGALDAVWSTAARTVTGGTIGTITGLTIANVENASTRFLTMIELDGAVYRYTTNALEQGPGGGSAPTAAAIADAVWDETTTGHNTAGTFGAAMIAAGSAGDPWATLADGSYDEGTYGYLVLTTIPGLLTGSEITVSSPVTADGGTITLRRGNDYLLAIGTQVPLTFSGLPYTLVGGTMTLKRPNGDTWACTITGASTAYLERTNAQTSELIPNQAGETVEFDVTLSGGQKVSPATATLVIQAEV